MCVCVSVCVCVCVCVCGEGEVRSDMWCKRSLKLCVYMCHRHMCVYLHESMCVHVQKCIFSVCVCVCVSVSVCGDLFNRNCHFEASWHPEAITSCVLEYFLNCSEMFRASPNDFHNRAVTRPFTPCEKIPTHLNPLVHRLNRTEKAIVCCV